MNPLLFSIIFGKYLKRLATLALLLQPVKKKLNLDFKLAFFCLKTDIILYPACDTVGWKHICSIATKIGPRYGYVKYTDM